VGTTGGQSDSKEADRRLGRGSGSGPPTAAEPIHAAQHLASGPTLMRPGPLLALQRATGNQAVLRLIGNSGDPASPTAVTGPPIQRALVPAVVIKKTKLGDRPAGGAKARTELKQNTVLAAQDEDFVGDQDVPEPDISAEMESDAAADADSFTEAMLVPESDEDADDLQADEGGALVAGQAEGWVRVKDIAFFEPSADAAEKAKAAWSKHLTKGALSTLLRLIVAAAGSKAPALSQVVGVAEAAVIKQQVQGLDRILKNPDDYENVMDGTEPAVRFAVEQRTRAGTGKKAGLVPGVSALNSAYSVAKKAVKTAKGDAGAERKKHALALWTNANKGDMMAQVTVKVLTGKSGFVEGDMGAEWLTIIAAKLKPT
jgi:hypothetical protein